MEHIDRFQPSYYQFRNHGLCTAQDAMGCKFTWCQITMTWWIVGSYCNVLLPITTVQTSTNTEVARIAKKFSARLASFGAWEEN